MDLSKIRQAKDQTVRLGFASLMASYCLLAVITSAPKAKINPQDGSYQPLALVQPQPQPSGEGLSGGESTASSTDPAATPDEWWREHQNIARLRGKWWLGHHSFETAKQSRVPVRLASLPNPAGTFAVRSFWKPSRKKPKIVNQAKTAKIIQKTAIIKSVPVALKQQDDRPSISEVLSHPPQILQSKPIGKPVSKAPIVEEAQDALTVLQLVLEARVEDKPADELPEVEPQPQAKPQAEPKTKPVIVASLLPVQLPTLNLPKKMSYGGFAELLPAVITNNFKRAVKRRSIEPVYNQCAEGKIAGWSGIKLLSRHKEQLKQSSHLDPQNVSQALQYRLAAKGFTAGTSVFMRIFKDRSQLQVWLKKDDKFELFHTYDICRWSGSFGPKLYEGDKQSPEGFYLVNRQLFNRPSFKWKGSFSIGYPNAYDKMHGRTGSLILVHGGCTSSGCFAMTNPVIQEVRELAQLARQNGQDKFSVHVYPFELTSANLAKYKNSPWLDFWNNLKTGYDMFEETRLPPRVRVCNKHYVFAKSGEERSGVDWSGKGCYGLAARIPGWKPAIDTSRRVRRAGRRCNMRRASCRKWVALKRKKHTRKRRKSSKRTRLAAKRRATMRRARAIGRKRK